MAGLPYRWWRDAEFWVSLVCLFAVGVLGFVLTAAWLLDWKPTW